MNAASWALLVGLVLGVVGGLALAGLMQASRRGDDLAEAHRRDREAVAARERLRMVLGHGDDRGEAS